MTRAALAVLAPIALTACNGGAADTTLLENEAERAAVVADLRGWDRVFAAPDATIAAANQFGFRVPDYAAVAPATGFVARGGPITMSQSAAATPNRATFVAAGPAADRIATLTFSLDVTDRANAAAARERMAGVVRDFLFQFGVEAAGTTLEAVRAGRPIDGDIAGARTVVSTRPDGALGDDAAMVSVTIHRPQATSPDIQPAQGQ